jgi:hypothetical protein
MRMKALWRAILNRCFGLLASLAKGLKIGRKAKIEPASADDTAYRRIPPDWLVVDPKAQGGRRASKEAFRDDKDGDPMSAYLKATVDRLGLRASDVVSGKGPRWAVAAASVAMLMSEDQTVQPLPIVDSPVPHCCDPAHASVVGDKKDKRRRERMAAASTIVHVSP